MGETPAEPGPNYRLFDEGARRLLTIAAQTASRCGADEVGALHLAMALADTAETSSRLAEWHVDPPSLTALPITGDDIRARYEIPFHSPAMAAGDRVAFDADVRAVLDGVGAIADAQGDAYVGCEHLMVSLLLTSSDTRALFDIDSVDDVPAPGTLAPAGKKTVTARQQRRYVKQQTKKSLRQLRRMKS